MNLLLVTRPLKMYHCRDIRSVQVGCDWHCYAWDFQECRINILDPTCMDLSVEQECRINILDPTCMDLSVEQECRINILDPTCMDLSVEEAKEKHALFVNKFHDALFDCKNTFFRGWNVSRKNWSTRFIQIAGTRGSRMILHSIDLRFCMMS